MIFTQNSDQVSPCFPCFIICLARGSLGPDNILENMKCSNIDPCVSWKWADLDFFYGLRVTYSIDQLAKHSLRLLKSKSAKLSIKHFLYVHTNFRQCIIKCCTITNDYYDYCDYHIEDYKENITKEGTVNLKYPGVSSHKCMFRLDGGDE